MNYLDYSEFVSFLRHHYAAGLPTRLVGAERQYDSGYAEIVRFFGDRAIDPNAVAVTGLDKPFVFGDPNICRFAAAMAEQMRRDGILRPGPPVMSVVTADLTATSPLLTVQPADYAAFAGSCLALDVAHEMLGGRTLRDYYHALHPTPTLTGNPLCCCLGVCGLLLVREAGRQYLLVVKRAAHLTSLAGTIGASVAGIVDWRTDSKSLADLACIQLTLELDEELGLQPGEFRIDLLGWGLELFRGEKPQILALVTTGLSRKALAARFDKLPTATREFSAYEFVPFDPANPPGPDFIERLNHEARANYYLVEEFLYAHNTLA